MSSTWRKGKKWKLAAWTTGCSKPNDGCSAYRDTVRESEPQQLCEHGTVRGEPHFSSRTSYFLNDLRQSPHCCSTLTSQMPSKGCRLTLWAELPSHTCLFPHLSLDSPPYISVWHRSGHSSTAQHQEVREPTCLSKPRGRERKEEEAPNRRAELRCQP